MEYSYTTYNVDAHNAGVSSNESAERRALGNLIGRGLEDTNSQRAREREAQRRAESARLEAEAKSKRQQAEWQQTVDMTSALLQSSTQKSEQALAAANSQLEQVVASYGSEDEEMARIVAQAKAAAHQAGLVKRRATLEQLRVIKQC